MTVQNAFLVALATLVVLLTIFDLRGVRHEGHRRTFVVALAGALVLTAGVAAWRWFDAEGRQADLRARMAGEAAAVSTARSEQEAAGRTRRLRQAFSDLDEAIGRFGHGEPSAIVPPPIVEDPSDGAAVVGARMRLDATAAELSGLDTPWEAARRALLIGLGAILAALAFFWPARWLRAGFELEAHRGGAYSSAPVLAPPPATSDLVEQGSRRGDRIGGRMVIAAGGFVLLLVIVGCAWWITATFGGGRDGGGAVVASKMPTNPAAPVPAPSASIPAASVPAAFSPPSTNVCAGVFVRAAYPVDDNGAPRPRCFPGDGGRPPICAVAVTPGTRIDPTQIWLNVDTGRRTACEHGGYCYPVEAMRLNAACAADRNVSRYRTNSAGEDLGEAAEALPGLTAAWLVGTWAGAENNPRNDPNASCDTDVTITFGGGRFRDGAAAGRYRTDGRAITYFARKSVEDEGSLEASDAGELEDVVAVAKVVDRNTFLEDGELWRRCNPG